MPCAAAAFVTSGSLAAPSSMEYSVCTCRWTKESDPPDGAALLTVLLCSSQVVRARPGGTRRATGGEDRQCSGAYRRAGTSILALPRVYSEGLTERVSSLADRSVTSAPPGPSERRQRMVTCA